MIELIYDIIGIGIGPFNLGLAALADEIPGLQCIFFDAKECFDWHPGLMIGGARMQVPFYADLVTLANPCSKYSYLNFLKAKQRLFRFAIQEKYFPTRKEYNEYCKWVVSGLDALQFGKTCTGIFYSKKRGCYGVQVRDNNTHHTKCFWTRHIVIGTGTVPSIPGVADHMEDPLLFHSSQYLDKKQELLKQNNITIIGSGQSAAEIFNDLVDNIKIDAKLKWYTRAQRFSPMDYSKFSLEMSSPEYINYFYQLDGEQKRKTLSGQNTLYKGINFSLIEEIYDKLYERSLDENGSMNNVGLFANSELVNISKQENSFKLEFKNKETHKSFHGQADAVILATGYKNIVPGFLRGIEELILWNENNFYDVGKDYSITEDKTIFVQNADLFSHGFNSADLGLGPYRNSVIINAILGKEYFSMEKNSAFQSFSVMT
jgi:lysine N6-hydroxylase